MVIAFVGAGSYVFGPSALLALLRSGLDDVELRLIDPATDTIVGLARAVESSARRAGKRIRVSTHTMYGGALSDADFLLHCAAPAMHADFERHKSILARRMPGHLISDFGGVHGLAVSVRQLEFTASLARVLALSSPRARMFVTANPLPRVCRIAQALGVETVGFCSVASNAYRTVSLMLGEGEDSWPFERTRERYAIRVAGTNHLSWALSVTDRATGEDLYPRLRRGADPESPSKTERLLARTGWLPTAGDDHIQDFLPIEGVERDLGQVSHGSATERAQRFVEIEKVVRGELEFEALDKHPSWEDPIGAMEALSGGRGFEAITLNLSNAGQLPQLPLGAFVESACVADRGGFHPEGAVLPEEVLKFNLDAAELNEACVRAVLDRSLKDLETAVELDPTIEDKALGLATLLECLEADQTLAAVS